MGDCFKGCREIMENEDTDVAGVVGHVLLELGGNCSFQDLTKKRKVGDWLVIGEVIQVETWLEELIMSNLKLLMSTMMGHGEVRHALNKEVTMGSREQAEALALVTSFTTYGASTLEEGK